MAKTLSKTGITDGSTIEVSHVTQSIDALTGIDAYDITISGSLTLSGGTQMVGTSSVATNIVITDASADTSTFVLLAGNQTGNQGAKSDAGLTYNANTNALTAATFIGDLSGNASTATSATSATNATTAENATKVNTSTSEDTESYLLMVEGSEGNQPPKLNTGLSFNNSTNALTTTTFIGALTGNASTATSATTATSASYATTSSLATTSLTNAAKTGGSENKITFTKGDASTFNVTLAAIPTSFASSTEVEGAFPATPDTTGKAVAGWVDIIIGGTTYYIPVWSD